MARVPYADVVPGAPGAEELEAAYADIAGLGRQVGHLYRALGNRPPALRAFLGMSRYVRNTASLPANLRELAILATGYALDVKYEVQQHLPEARKAGVTEAQLAAFPNWAASDHFDETERAVLTYADTAARTGDVDDATWARVQQLLPMPQLMDLVVTVAWYHFVALILVPLRIDLQPQA